MKKWASLIASILGAAVLGGCAGPAGRTAADETRDPYFRPKRVYSVNLNQAWDLTLKALNREGVPLEMVNRETGVVQTAYQNISPWERNKCDIRFSAEPQRRTYIYVRCRYEGRKEATEPFRDFTYTSPREAMRAEEELYRKLEPYILPFEGTAAASPEAPPPSVPRAAAPIVEKSASQPPAAPPPAPPPAARAEAAPPVSMAVPPKPEIREETIGAGAASPKLEPGSGAAAPGPPPAAAAAADPRPAPAAPPAKTEAVPPAARVAPPQTGVEKPGVPEFLVTVAPTNVRGGPSTRGKVLTVLPRGERVEKIGESGNWVRIRLPWGEDGWVFSDFLQSPSAAATAPLPKPSAGARSAQPRPPSAKIAPPKAPLVPPAVKAGEPAPRGAVAVKKPLFATKDITPMRGEPDAGGRVVLVLKKGRRVEKLAESGEFAQVRLPWGDTGWVPTRSLQSVP